MSFAFAKDTVRKGLDAHSAIGLVCCALLYLICATGTAVVLYEEWQRFEQPDAPEMTSIAPAAVQQGIENVLAAESDLDTTTHLYVHMPTEALPRTTITTDTQAFHVDADGAIVVPEENAWAEFLLALHYRLNLPAVYGMTLVGAFGAMIVALSISGIVAHPRIFRDAFRLRARRRDDVATVDWHNRLAVWSLPFALAIALTGAMIGLFYVSGGSMAASAYGGDSEAAIAPIFGAEAEADLTPAPVADAVPALTYMAREYPDVTPYYVILHDPSTAGQHVQIVGEHERRLIFGEYYAFGPQGEFHGTAGMADGTVGQQLAASTYNLHFGNYGGLPVKIA
ncbi:MAG: PepSY-associated TM helix domain-containing protein, partial [Pseudomonadota bacterium]|nr:PepSY-associated TM helix domain-containing protein [Pseudomonadota bacterium]